MIEKRVGDGRYQLKRLIGTGGTADVYEADDMQLHRPVAVKLLHERVLDDELLSASLLAEVRISRTLAHAGIVEVYDYSTELAGEAYLVMEYMAGGDLRKRLLSLGTLPGQEVARISALLLSALSVAHERGVVHRDLKPRNVLFTSNGTAKIADFGLARSITGAGLFQKDTIAGTPEYTAPETITSSLWDPRSDLYALGCTLYEAVAGSPPFVANTPAEVLRMQVEADPPPLPEEFTRARPEIAELIMLLLEKDPNRRPQTASEAEGMLSTDSVRSPVIAAPTEPCPSCGAPLSRHYGWCFTCGRPNLPVHQDRSGYSVLITGPGKAGEKASPEFRDACCGVATSAGLDPAKMQKQVPRLPFVLARDVDYGGAIRLCDELRSIGAEVTLVGPGEQKRSSLLRSISRKALTMTPRVYVVILGMGAATWVNTLRNLPAGVVLAVLGLIIAAVPVALTLSFSRATAKWRDSSTERGGENLTRLLATVRDPLIHARMKSMAESARGVAADAESDRSTSDEEKELVRRWSHEIVERTAGLCIGLDAAASSRRYSEELQSSSVGDSSGAEAQTTAKLLRDADALHTRTLELVGRSALEVRELSVRLARTRGSQTRRELQELQTIVSRFGDEGEAWREIRELEGGTS